MTWKQVKFSELVESPPKVTLRKGEKFSFIPMELIIPAQKYVVPIDNKTFTGGGAKFGEGDVIFARITPCLENGKIAKVKGLENGLGFGSTEYLVFRARKNLLDADFLYYLVISPQIREVAIKSMTGSSGRQRAKKEAIDELTISVPSYEKQVKIAAILSTYDDLIENNRRRIQLLEQATRLIYEEWFIRFRFPGHEKVRIVDGLPERWRFIEIREITSFISRGITPTYRADAEYVVLNQKCIRNKKIDFSLSQKQSKRVSSEKLIRFGDVLINSTGTGTLGRVAQLWINVENTTVDSHISIVRPQSFINHYWFGMTLLYKEPIFETLGEGSTNQTELKREKIGAQQVLLPPENIQKKFEDICQPIISQISTLQKQIENLKIARDLLLPKLMNGEIQI